VQWLDWIGLDWIGLDWIGLDWIGLDWIGLDWIGLAFLFKHDSNRMVSNATSLAVAGQQPIALFALAYLLTFDNPSGARITLAKGKDSVFTPLSLEYTTYYTLNRIKRLTHIPVERLKYAVRYGDSADIHSEISTLYIVSPQVTRNLTFS
jgi:hypothetical protein